MKKSVEKETIKREIRRSGNGFKHVKENKSHSLYEERSDMPEDPDRELEETGAGNAVTEKIVTPDGEELTNLTEVFRWISENVDKPKFGGDFNLDTESTFSESDKSNFDGIFDQLNKSGYYQG